MNRLSALVVGAPAFLIAMLCLAFIVTNTRQFDSVIINDHVVGGTSDRFAAFAVGGVSGAVAVACAIRLRRPD